MEVARDVLADLVLWVQQVVAKTGETLKLIFLSYELSIESLLHGAFIGDINERDAHLSIRGFEGFILLKSLHDDLNHLVNADVISLSWV